jgi:signal-transduction protein with cAMP-binding, CBS, and nucleotidyltransferase domain
MSHDNPLSTFRVEPGTSIAQAEPWNTKPVTLDSPALEVMTDLTLVKAATIHPTTGLRQAEQAMIYLGVRMLFVVSEMPTIEGLITSTDLRSDKQMRVVSERHLRFDELCVADVMNELSLLDAVDYARICTARVGHMVATLQHLGRNHLLVVERFGTQDSHRVRGVISRAQIERQLGTTIEVSPIAHSFSEIERALV